MRAMTLSLFTLVAAAASQAQTPDSARIPPNLLPVATVSDTTSAKPVPLPAVASEAFAKALPADTTHLGIHLDFEGLLNHPSTKYPKGSLDIGESDYGCRAEVGLRYRIDRETSFLLYGGYARTNFGVSLGSGDTKITQSYANHMLLFGLGWEDRFLHGMLAYAGGISAEIPLSSEVKTTLPASMSSVTGLKSGTTDFDKAGKVVMIDAALGHWFSPRVGAFVGMHAPLIFLTDYYQEGSGDSEVRIDNTEWTLGLRFHI